MGLRIVQRNAEGVSIESVYEGLAPAPPYLGGEAVGPFRIVAPRYLSSRTVGCPGNVVVTLAPVSSDSRAMPTDYQMRDGEMILLDGVTDYDMTVQIIQNGAVEAGGGPIVPALLCSPIPSSHIVLRWGNDTAPVITGPGDQGALCVAMRIANIAPAAVVTTRLIRVPASGRVSWLADYSAGVAGDIMLLQGPIVQTAPLAPTGTWTHPDLIAGQEIKIRVRNTGNAGSLNVDAKVVRT